MPAAPKSRLSPLTAILLVGGAVLGLGAAGWWIYYGTSGAQSLPPPDPAAFAAAAKSSRQPPEIVWERTYGGAKIDAARRILPWINDGFVVAGRTRSKGQGGDDAWVVVIDGAGKEIGERLLGTPDFDWLTSMIKTRDGGLVLAGSRSDKDITRSAGWLLRLDAKSEQLWRHEFDGGRADGTSGITAVDETKDGGLIAAGSTSVNSAGQYDGWILRTDKDGRLLWQKTYGGAAEDALFAIAALPDGGAIATGAFGADGQGWVLRIDADGRTVWEKRLGGTGYDVLNAVAPLRAGGFVAVGTSRSHATPGGAAWVIHLDQAGGVVWERFLAPVRGANAGFILVLADGGLLLGGGSVVEPGTGEPEREKAWIARLGGDGAVLWTKVFASSGDENLFSALALPDGGFALAGFTNAKGAGEGDFWVMRLGYR
jgi:hypothetical protein